jgi:hypothetical protein
VIAGDYMSYIYFNPNPEGRFVGDCVIRAMSMALNQSWEKTYLDICQKGLSMHDMPSANRVWGAYLKDCGFTKHVIPDNCPDCYSVREFAYEHPSGTYILGTGTHVVAVLNGNYYDSWDSGDGVPIYYFKRR